MYTYTGIHVHVPTCTCTCILVTYHFIVIKDLDDDLWRFCGDVIGRAVDVDRFKDQRLVPRRAESLVDSLRRLTLVQEDDTSERVWKTGAKLGRDVIISVAR